MVSWSHELRGTPLDHHASSSQRIPFRFRYKSFRCSRFFGVSAARTRPPATALTHRERQAESCAGSGSALTLTLALALALTPTLTLALTLALTLTLTLTHSLAPR